MLQLFVPEKQFVFPSVGGVVALTVIEVSFEQSQNAASPILVTPEPMDILNR